MPGMSKLSLFLILLFLSLFTFLSSTGFAASSDNLSVNVKDATSISQIVKPYFDNLAESSGINIKEEPALFTGSWSPDGSRLVIDVFTQPMAGAGLYAVYVLNADGSGIRELTSTPNNTKKRNLSMRGAYSYYWFKDNPSFERQWSPDGSRIGIFTNIFTVRDFYVIADPDKTLIKTAGKCNYTTVDEIRENVLDLEWQEDFMWNPEGTKALILMYQEPLKKYQLYQLYLVDQNGFVIQQLTNIQNQQLTNIYNMVGFPGWSHDGKKIAYSVSSSSDQYENETGLWTINEDGTGNKKLADFGLFVAWSPDDSRIFYCDENHNLYSVKVDGTDEVQLSTEYFDRNDDAFSFSPDGKYLLFSTGYSDKTTLFLADQTGKNIKVLEEVPSRLIFKPSWSPNGDKIAFTENKDLYTINPDGSEKNLIASAITDYEWHPSGDFISFISSGSIFVASPNGSTKKQLIDGNNYKSLGDKSPRGWSSDGSRLLLCDDLITLITLEGYEDPLSIDLLDLPTPVAGENCELRVRCMSEPVADARLTFNEKEIGFTNSSGFLTYNCSDAGTYVINASKTGYRSASKILLVQENLSISPEKSIGSEASSDSGEEKTPHSEFKIPGFRGITVMLLLLFICRRDFL